MRKGLAILFVAVIGSASGRTFVDFYLDMEAGTNGETLTTNLLNACTHAAPGAGYWTLNRGHPKDCIDCWEQLSNVTDFAVLSSAGTNGVWQLRSPVTVNGITYADTNHTRVFGKGLNNRDQCAQFNFATPHVRVSVGYYYTMAVGYKNQNIFEILSTDLYNYSSETNWEFDIAASRITNRLHSIVFAHSQAGGADQSGGIPVNVEKTYWVTQLWDGSNGVAKVEVYDPLTWSKVGSNSQLVISNLPCQYLQLGEMQNTNTSYSVTNCFGNLVMDWTTATFPLLLPATTPVVPVATNIVLSWTPSNFATVERLTNGLPSGWQTYSNNARPPLTIPAQQLQTNELFRLRSSNSTTLTIKKG